MPRTPTITHPLFRLYFREMRLPDSTAMVARSVLNRWHAYLQGSCAGKCCSHRTGAMEIQEATKVDVLDWVHHMKAAKNAPATINSNLVKLRGFYDWAVQADEMNGNRNPCTGVKGEKPQQNIQPTMSEDMHAQLMKACAKIPDQKIKRRDKAIISLMFAVGMRRAEVAALDLASYNQDDHRPAIIVGTVEHATKTRKARVVPLPFATAALIDRYLVQRGPAPGPLFLPQRGERLTPAGIGQLFDRTKARAGITGPLGTHSNRRGFTCSARRADMSTDAIMEIVGWESELMVRRYSASEKTELAHDEFFAKMGGSKTPQKGRKAQPSRYGSRKAA